jgi:hypothetical protein
MGAKTRNIDWSKWDHLLGTDIDTEIAKVIGCKQPVVTKRRNMLGIPPLRSRGYSKLSAAVQAMLGKYPDGALGRLWGITNQSVEYHRKQRGIKRCDRNKSEIIADLLRALQNANADACYYAKQAGQVVVGESDGPQRYAEQARQEADKGEG